MTVLAHDGPPLDPVAAGRLVRLAVDPGFSEQTIYGPPAHSTVCLFRAVQAGSAGLE
jgi:hypothetical protein